MAKSKDTNVEVADGELLVKEVVVVTTPEEVADPSFSVEPPKKLITFEQFVSIKKLKPHHISGFKASVNDPAAPRTLEDWTAIHENY